ncbi:VOC family protein [Lysobacter sp. K5869]|uniref:VOC family protein n=1 Tax=Lysobacter sp. K5869 TaxID=2820808 RepID=UPI001C063A3E|nr:VOC family protein [Lysobacter sp. K5869]QWP77017.1 VOC family protein [Lysobacter sp. K5869]
MHLDHLILRVADAAASARFYRDALGLREEPGPAPFRVLRVDAGTTLDLLQEAPRDAAHLAFRLDRAGFERVRANLDALGVAYGASPFQRDGRSGRQYGAMGAAEALYFFDPDRHNLEIRTHEPAS